MWTRTYIYEAIFCMYVTFASLLNKIYPYVAQSNIQISQVNEASDLRQICFCS